MTTTAELTWVQAAISVPRRYAPTFTKMVSGLVVDVCWRHLGASRSQTAACVFIASCFCLPFRFQVSELVTLTSCPSKRILQSIRDVLTVMSPWSVPVQDVTLLETLSTHEYTVCHTVRIGDRTRVRKRILPTTDGEPLYMGIVELLVHRLLLSREHSPHVVHLYGSVIHVDGTVDLFYNYVPVQLSSYIASNHTTTEQRMVVIRHIIKGVHTLHSRNIAHRDLKTENIHVSCDTNKHLHTAVLLDLGSAGYGAYRETVPMCTISYRSPDILQAEIDKNRTYIYDGRTLDIWSIGVLVLEILLGVGVLGRPTDLTTAREMLDSIQSLLEPSLRRLRRSGRCLSSTQYNLICRCLSYDPTARPVIQTLLDAFAHRVSS